MIETHEVRPSAPTATTAQPSPGYHRFVQYSIPLLWGALIALFALNLAMFYGLNQVRLAAIDALSDVETALDDLTKAKVTYDLQVNESLPVQADIPFNYQANIPIDLTIPVDQSLEIPFTAPTGEGMTLAVPLKLDIPVQEIIPIGINETTRVDTVVPLNVTVPVELDLAQTTLADYVSQAKVDIAQLKKRLAFR